MGPFKVIKSEDEYQSALARFERMLAVSEMERPYDDMELLSVLIEQYETINYPIDPPDPIEAIKFRMEQTGLTQKDLIPYIGSRSKPWKKMGPFQVSILEMPKLRIRPRRQSDGS